MNEMKEINDAIEGQQGAESRSQREWSKRPSE